MKTPCQKLGYKVGDKFEVVCDDGVFSKGEIVTLIDDLGDTAPYFEGAGERCSWLDVPEDVKPLKVKKAKRPWIKWEGGECPVPEGTLIDVKHRDGEKHKKVPALGAYNYHWGHAGHDGDIVAYRLAKPKKAAEPAQEAQGEPTVQREANGRPVGAKEGDWFRVIKSWHFAPGTITTLQRDDGTRSPFFTDTGDKYLSGVAEWWVNMEPCPAPTQPEPECPQDSTCADQGCPHHYAESAQPEWEILWGSAKDFEGAPDWAVYAVGTADKFWVEDVTPGAKLMRYDVAGRVLSTVRGVANYRPYAARRLKQPK